jgi:hypothetical protein
MKANYLLNFGAILTVSCQIFLSSAQSAIAVPASIFQPILQDIRTQLPKGMVMRLPANVPDVGATTYAGVSGYFPEQGFFRIDLTSEPDCDATACNMGNIFVFRRGNSLGENDGLPDSRTKLITLKPGVRGFYSYYRSGSAGYRHHVFWKQDGLFFEVESRAMSKQQVINMAISMATEPPIRSAK